MQSHFRSIPQYKNIWQNIWSQLKHLVYAYDEWHHRLTNDNARRYPVHFHKESHQYFMVTVQHPWRTCRLGKPYITMTDRKGWRCAGQAVCKLSYVFVCVLGGGVARGWGAKFDSACQNGKGSKEWRTTTAGMGGGVVVEGELQVKTPKHLFTTSLPERVPESEAWSALQVLSCVLCAVNFR